MQTLTIRELKRQATDHPLEARVFGQLQSVSHRSTKHGKPYLEVSLADSGAKFSLKVWSDNSAYALLDRCEPHAVLGFEAMWTQGGFGMEARDLLVVVPDEAALDAFFAGDPELHARQENDLVEIRSICDTLADPRLRTLCAAFLDKFGSLLRRTAAARRNHHARRGGLVEHTAQMMRTAQAVCGVYPHLNRDLLLCGVLFHDAGKLWENSYPERGFAQNHSMRGEMLGHIPMGIELVNHLWREVFERPDPAWTGLLPSAEETRLHLLHLVASHHGELEFGSPVLPHTPEAMALHYIDNLDARLEMAREAYASSPELAPGIHERVFPMSCNLVRPLQPCRIPDSVAEVPD